MRRDKRLQKLIDLMVKNSLNKTGALENHKVKKFVGSLSKLPRQNAIFALSDFSKKLRQQVDRTTLEIESAIRISPIQVRRIVNAFKADYKIHDVKVIVNSKLIGGIRLKLGDKVFEDSIISRIEQLRGVIAE